MTHWTCNVLFYAHVLDPQGIFSIALSLNFSLLHSLSLTCSLSLACSFSLSCAVSPSFSYIRAHTKWHDTIHFSFHYYSVFSYCLSHSCTHPLHQTTHAQCTGVFMHVCAAVCFGNLMHICVHIYICIHITHLYTCMHIAQAFSALDRSLCAFASTTSYAPVYVHVYTWHTRIHICTTHRHFRQWLCRCLPRPPRLRAKGACPTPSAPRR